MAKSKSVKKTAPAKKKAAKKTAANKTAKKVAVKKASVKKVAKKLTAKKTKTKQTATQTKRVKTQKQIQDNEMLALTVAQGMYEKKAENIRILDLRKVQGASADFFVISHADNDKQVEAIANSVEDEVKKILGITPWHREGFTNLQWVLIDYIDVVAHVFLEEKRNFYDIESLWGDATEVPFKGK